MVVGAWLLQPYYFTRRVHTRLPACLAVAACAGRAVSLPNIFGAAKLAPFPCSETGSCFIGWLVGWLVGWFGGLSVPELDGVSLVGPPSARLEQAVAAGSWLAGGWRLVCHPSTQACLGRSVRLRDTEEPTLAVCW